MTNSEKKYTAENLRPRFREFLERTHTADIDGLMAYAETELPQVLSIYFDVLCDGVYELRDRHILLDARSRVQTNSALRDLNTASGSRLSQALRKYADFLQSKYFQEKFPAKTSRNSQFTIHNSQSASSTKPAPEETERELTEGAKKHVEAERAWRNPELRKACLDHYGYQCQCCGMDFESVYGDAGKCFIEVHHLRPISTYDGEHEVNPLTDLVPLCSNCHSMIHRGENGTMTLEELRAIYRGPKFFNS